MTRSLLPASLAAAIVLALAACQDERIPTQPESAGDPVPAVAASLALAANTWTLRAPIPLVLNLLSAAEFPNSAGHSVVYTFGGTLSDINRGGVFAYDVVTDTWTGKASTNGLPQVYEMNGVGRIGNLLYMSGGSFSVDEQTPVTWAYDPAANTWTRKADMPKATAAGVSGVIDGKLWVLPGFCSTELYPSPGYCNTSLIRQIFRYDPVTNRWAARHACPHYHKYAAGGVLDGKFYVAGGLGSTDLDVYDPATNTWQTLAPLPTGGVATGAVLGGRLWVLVSVGGQPRSYVYDRATNTWKTRAPPTEGHDAVVPVTLDGQRYLLAVGGEHIPNPSADDTPNDNELYTR